jgi:hypothetical protein
MANYLENGLRAMEKSLRDVVSPALSSGDPLAREQLNLAIDYLGFLRSRLDHATHQLRFELDLYRDMAARVIEVSGAALESGAIDREMANTAALRDDVWAGPQQLRDGVTRLAAAIDDAVAAAARSGDDALRSRVDRAVHAITEHWIAFDSAWYAPIAVDPDAPGLKPVDTFFPYRSPGWETAA